MTGRWGFTTSRPTDARYGDDVAKYAMSSSEQGLKTFVREVLQNSNDARFDSEDPAKVTFRLETLENEELEAYFDAFDVSEWSEHAQLAGKTEGGEHIKNAIERIKDEGQIRVLTIEDENTQGLIGSETADQSNFTALVRDVLFSSKSGETSGGSYGLGKAVLWLFSGLSTVMFNSILSEPSPRGDSPRLIGRTRLPTHKSEDGETVYQGHGWFGSLESDEEGARPESLWGDDAESVADHLHLDRPNRPGTSIQVVDFRVPTAEERYDDEELATQITNHAIEWFWPAIQRGSLEVTVETDEETHEATLEEHPNYVPFVSCLRDREEASSKLEEPGDVVDRSISLDVPASDQTDETTGELNLLVRRSQSSETYLENEVALVRGAGMVVEYYDRDKVVIGNEDFHGVLLAGRARPWGTNEPPTQSDEVIEKFLTAAEPPRHNRWERTETLANTYEKGFRTAIEGIKSDVTDELRKVVAPEVERGSTGPERLGNRFKIGNKSRSGDTTKSSPSSRRVSGWTDIQFDEAYDHWMFEGEVEPMNSGHEIRSVTVSLIRMAEERATTDRLEVKNISSSTTGVSISLPEENNVQVGRLKPQEATTSVMFEGFSEEDPRRVETRLKVSVDVAEKGEN